MYYIQTPPKTTQNVGKIFFQDDRMSQERSVEIPADQGVIILFPGYLKHGVQTNISDVERLSLSFTIKIKKK